MKTKFMSNTLSMANWNVYCLECRDDGVKCNKLDDPEVIKFLNMSDCIGLIKTHADNAVEFSLPGYYVFRKDRVKYENAHIPSCGIAVLIKESMRQYYKFDPVSTGDIIWVKILKDYIPMSNDLYLIFVYIPPFNSSFDNSKYIMSQLEKQIEYFSCKGKVLLCGDLTQGLEII